MSSNKIDFRSIPIEATLIVFTVVLALAVNEWREGQKEKRVRDTILENIIKEVKTNKELVEEKMVYHDETSKKLGEYLNSDSLWNTLPPGNGLFALMSAMPRGLNPPLVQSAAWRSAELSGVVSGFEYETLYNLSSLYSLQATGVESTWKGMAQVYMDYNSYKEESRRDLALMLQMGFGELYSQERSLVYTYENVLDFLENGE